MTCLCGRAEDAMSLAPGETMFVTRLNKSARGVCEACGGGRTDCETAVMPEAPPEFLRSALDTPPIWSSTGLMETEIHTLRERVHT